VVNICLADAVALHVDWAEGDGRLHLPDLVDALAKDFGVGIVSSRDRALAHELLEHLDIFQVSAVQDGGVVSSGVVSDGRQHAEFQPIASRAATAQLSAPAFAEQSANRLGRVEVELIFTLTEVLIGPSLHEQRFEASIREAFELVCVVLPQGAYAVLPFCQK